jgi:hypothetical protein
VADDIETLPGGNESTEEGSVPEDGAGMVLPDIAIVLIMVAAASSWFSL